MIFVTLNWLTLFVVLTDSKNNGKGMWLEYEQPFLWGKHCVTSQKAVAKQTNFVANYQ